MAGQAGTGSGEVLVGLRGAAKRYRRYGPWVVEALDVDLAPGELVDLRGPNGAGKSTLLRLLAGASSLTRGTRVVAPGLTVGYAPEGLAAPPFTAAGFLAHHVRLRRGWGRERAAVEAEIPALAARLDCGALMTEKMPALSKGSLRKMVLIQALLGSPDLLVLDEPFDGLDRAAQVSLGEIVEERRADGAAIVLSDHRQDGRRTRPDAIWQLDGAAVRVGESGPGPGVRHPLLDLAGVAGGSVADGRARLRVDPSAIDNVLRALLDRGWHVETVAPGADRVVAIEATEPRR